MEHIFLYNILLENMKQASYRTRFCSLFFVLKKGKSKEKKTKNRKQETRMLSNKP